MRKSPVSWAASAVFLATAAFLYWSYAHRFVMSNDEGIFVEGSRRILQGKLPYRDFFILMGPGSFWLQAAALKLLGMTMAASRAVTILDLSVIGGCVFWWVARRSNLALAGFVAAICLILQTTDPVVALPNHRWDSAALAILSVTLLEFGGRRWTAFLAGACAAFAAWVTPSVALFGSAVAGVLWVSRRSRLWPFLAGGTAVCAAVLGVLAWTGSLQPLLRQVLWTGTNYAGVNYMAYGSRFGGYARLFEDAEGFEVVTRGLVVLGISLPAVLPVLALPLCWKLRKSEALLIAAAFSLLATAYPRLDVPHLVYPAPLFYILIAVGLTQVQNPKLRLVPFVLSTLLMTMFAFYVFIQRSGEVEIASRVGPIRASASDAKLIQALERQFPAGSGMFVFPYLPILYFVTLGENPTRYSYLQPGMMSEADEQAAMADLSANPPAQVLFYDFPESEILRIWPATDPSRLRLRRLEAYLSRTFQVTREIPYNQSVFQVLQPAAQSLAAK